MSSSQACCCSMVSFVVMIQIHCATNLKSCQVRKLILREMCQPRPRAIEVLASGQMQHDGSASMHHVSSTIATRGEERSWTERFAEVTGSRHRSQVTRQSNSLICASAHLASELFTKPELLSNSSLGAFIHDIHPPLQCPPGPLAAVAMLQGQSLLGSGQLLVLSS